MYTAVTTLLSCEERFGLFCMTPWKQNNKHVVIIKHAAQQTI